jgi:hypothetical protein
MALALLKFRQPVFQILQKSSQVRHGALTADKAELKIPRITG